MVSAGRGGTPDSGLYGEASPNRGTFIRYMKGKGLNDMEYQGPTENR